MSDIPATPDDANKHEMLDQLSQQGWKLHPEAHLDTSTLDQLSSLIKIGNPTDWMGPMLNKEIEIPTDMNTLPDSFRCVYEALERHTVEIKQCIGIMTRMANNGNINDESDRYKYQQAEMRIMFLVRKAVLELTDQLDPNTVELILALNGASIFKRIFMEDSGDNVTEVQLKRIRATNLERTDDTFFVGIQQFSQESITRLICAETLVFTDDCLSTGITQLALLERILRLGAKPKRVIFTFTVATIEGLKHMEDTVKRLAQEYQLDDNFKLLIGAGGLCYRVNEAMYLLNQNGEYMVGDMGAWGKLTRYGYPNGKNPIVAEA